MPEYFSFPDPCSTTGSRNCVFRSTPRWRRRCRTIIFSNCDCDMSSWHYDYQTRNCAQFYWRTPLKVKISESVKRLDLENLYWFYIMASFFRINNFHDIYCSQFEQATRLDHCLDKICKFMIHLLNVSRYGNKIIEPQILPKTKWTNMFFYPE